MLIDWFTVTAQLVNFAVLVWLLRRLLYRRILDAMDTRQAAILSEAERADAHRRRAESEADAYAEKLAQFEKEYAFKMQRAEEEISAFRSGELARAREEIRSQRAEWSQSLDRQKREFIEELRQLVGDQVCEVARKLVSDLADASLEQQMLRHFVTSIATRPADRDSLLAAIDGKAATLLFETTFPVDLGTETFARDRLGAILPSGCEIRFHQSERAAAPCGIALHTAGHLLEWNVDSYSRQLAENVAMALAAETVRAFKEGRDSAPATPP